MRQIIFCLAAVIAISPIASATTLSGTLGADDSLVVYLSTSPTVQGTEISSGTGWEASSVFTTELTAGTTYYLEIAVSNWSDVGSFLGSLSLSDAGFSFENGTQSLNTNTTDWTYSYTGFGTESNTPTSYGNNDATAWPWGVIDGAPVAGISTDAEWLWDANLYYPYTAADPTTASNPEGDGILYFETEITPAPTPEPASLTLLGSGLLALGGLVARRRRSA